MKTLKSMKVSTDAHGLLRVVAALTGERQYEVLERLLKAELARLRVEENKP